MRWYLHDYLPPVSRSSAPPRIYITRGRETETERETKEGVAGTMGGRTEAHPDSAALRGGLVRGRVWWSRLVGVCMYVVSRWVRW